MKHQVFHYFSYFQIERVMNYIQIEEIVFSKPGGVPRQRNFAQFYVEFIISLIWLQVLLVNNNRIPFLVSLKRYD